MELITMSRQELLRLDYVKKAVEHRITQLEASEQLGISLRQMQRLVQSYRKNNYTGILSKKRGKSSNNSISVEFKSEILDIVIKHYHDFGPTLAKEKLYEVHGYKISVETLRKWMIEHDLWVPRKQRLKRAYQPRYRRNCEGELVQIDGSFHRWFEDRGPKCTLLVYVDDATSKLKELRFVSSESMHTYFISTKAYINRHGRPLAFYSDKLNVFRNNGYKEEAKSIKATQFGRALQELDIQLICANTCQAKGRVERANKTLQDRLIKEMRLRNISTVEEGNAYLEEFMEDYNRRFAKIPVSSEDKHRTIPAYMDINNLLCFKTTRTVSLNLTFQHDRQLYMLKDSMETRALRRKQVLLCEYPEGGIKVFYGTQELEYDILYDRVKHQPQGTIVTSNKYLSDVLEYAKKRAEELKSIKRSRSAPRKNHLKYSA